MKKSVLTILLLLSTSVVYGALISRTYSYTAGNTITADQNNTNENTLYTEINGNLESANIKDGTIVAADIANTTITAAKIDTTNFVLTLSSMNVTNFTTSTMTIANQIGVTDGSSAFAGNYGVLLSSYSVGVNLASSTNWTDGPLLTVPAGEWEIVALGFWAKSGATWSETAIGISSTTGNSTAGLILADTEQLDSWQNTNVVTANNSMMVMIPRLSQTVSTVWYFKCESTYTAGTPTLRARLTARRIR